jgi:glycosyltransferase involved in cell wall biosynthesis
LAALERCRPQPDELILVVNGAHGAVEDQARRSGAVVVVEKAPLGPGPARNRGAREATSDVLLFVDSDVEVAPDVVGRVRRHFSDAGGPSAVFGSYDENPAADGVVSRYRNLLHHWVHQHGNEEASTFWTCCGAVRRSVFEEAGGFRDTYIEDVVFGLGLRRAGHRIRLDAGLQVRHLKRWTLVDLVTVDLVQRAIPWSEMIVRDGRLINDLNVDSVSRVSVGLVGLLLVSGVAAIAWPPAAVAVLAAALLLVTVNLPFYRFLARRGGPWFATLAVPLHWLYYLVCGVGFGVGALRAVVFRERASRPAENEAEAA